MPPLAGGHGQATWLRPPYTGACPLRRSLFSFYLLLLGPAGQVQAEKEQVRGKIKRFLGGASPLQTSPAGWAKRPTLCRETTRALSVRFFRRGGFLV